MFGISPAMMRNTSIRDATNVTTKPNNTCRAIRSQALAQGLVSEVLTVTASMQSFCSRTQTAVQL